jgi:Fe-S oxidoreductase
MLQGDVIGKQGWQDEHVKDALDLCLVCKGCKGDCPVNVDMATYKAEFLAHYYERRWRPRTAYAFGLIYRWARLAALAPSMANFVTRAPGLRTLSKAVAGMAPERQIPAFAPQTFKAWFQGRAPHNLGEPRVLLWPDTFNNYFHPETARAGVEVLEAAGYQVIVPDAWLCCGRPLYDYGMLDRAKRQLRQILATLRPHIADGVPVIVLEPSCAAVFRDELINLFPHDTDARRLHQQTFLLSEFLEEHAKGFEIPRLPRHALVHGHCHHKAIMGMAAEEGVLSRLGLDYQVLDSGCCGMAGSFGFERGDRYEVSVKAGERVLLPAIRRAAADTLLIADGYSCREQITQMTGRRALHVAEVVQMALHRGQGRPAPHVPEPAGASRIHSDGRRRSQLLTVALVGAALALVLPPVWRLTTGKLR